MLRRIQTVAAATALIVLYTIACGEPDDEPTFDLQEPPRQNVDGPGEQICEPDDDGYSCAVDCNSDDWPDAWTDDAQRLVEELNDQRADGVDCGTRNMQPVDRLQPHDRLTRAARCHALDMAENQFFAHEGSDGSDEVDRARRAGYDSGYVGENLAVGQRSPPDVIVAWTESEGHCINLMHPAYHNVGTAVVEAGQRRWWVQTYGTP